MNGAVLREIGSDPVAADTMARLFLEYCTERYTPGPVPSRDWVRVGTLVSRTLDGSYRSWLALADGLPVGFGCLTDEALLAPAWVAPAFRRRGIHTQLLDVRIAAGGTWTTVLPDNSASIASLTAAGFSPAGLTDSGLVRMVLTAASGVTA